MEIYKCVDYLDAGRAFATRWARFTLARAQTPDIYREAQSRASTVVYLRQGCERFSHRSCNRANDLAARRPERSTAASPWLDERDSP